MKIKKTKPTSSKSQPKKEEPLIYAKRPFTKQGVEITAVLGKLPAKGSAHLLPSILDVAAIDNSIPEPEMSNPRTVYTQAGIKITAQLGSSKKSKKK